MGLEPTAFGVTDQHSNQLSYVPLITKSNVITIVKLGNYGFEPQTFLV